MVSAATALANLLLTSAAVLAVPSLDTTSLRRAAAAAAGHQSDITQYQDAPFNGVEYKIGNWGGAVYNKPADTFSLITTIFTIPDITSPGIVSAWISIDGDSCTSASIRLGINFGRDSSGVFSATGWTQWKPLDSTDFTTLTVLPNHVVRLTIAVSSHYTGSAIIENTSNRQIFTHTFQPSPYALCQKDAVWGIQGFGTALPNFGTIVFNDAHALTTTGNIGANDTIRVFLASDDYAEILTTTSADNLSINVTYVGQKT